MYLRLQVSLYAILTRLLGLYQTRQSQVATGRRVGERTLPPSNHQRGRRLWFVVTQRFSSKYDDPHLTIKRSTSPRGTTKTSKRRRSSRTQSARGTRNSRLTPCVLAISRLGGTTGRSKRRRGTEPVSLSRSKKRERRRNKTSLDSVLSPRFDYFPSLSFLNPCDDFSMVIHTRTTYFRYSSSPHSAHTPTRMAYASFVAICIFFEYRFLLNFVYQQNKRSGRP